MPTIHPAIRMNITTTDPHLKLMYLVSPALPVGAYAYSQGLEYAVDSGWLANEEQVGEWIDGVLEHSVGALDLPALIRLYQAWKENDVAGVDYWNSYVRANRETSELLLEDEQLGLALRRLLLSLEIFRAEMPADAPVSFVTLFALAGVEWNIPLDKLLEGFCWSWLENQVAAATKLVPLGQTQAQRLLLKLMDRIPPVCKRAVSIDDDQIGVGLPGLAIASALHERQYSRLFRS